MSESLERWGDGAPDWLRDAASIYEQDAPSELELTRMLAHVERAAAADPGGPGPRATWRPKTIAKLLLGTIALGLLGLLSSRAPSGAPRVAPSRAQRAPAAAPVDAPPAPSLVAKGGPSPSLPDEAQDVVGTPVPAREPAIRRREARGLLREPSSPRSGEVLSELALLVRARRVLGHDPARAYALTEQHRESYRRGALSEERELLAIEALLALDRRAAAETRAAQFARRFPGSVHARKLTQLLGRGAP